MEGKVKLPQDLINCPCAEIEAYINAHLPGGHKRKLAEAVLQLRKTRPVGSTAEQVSKPRKAKDAA